LATGSPSRITFLSEGQHPKIRFKLARQPCPQDHIAKYPPFAGLEFNTGEHPVRNPLAQPCRIYPADYGKLNQR
jgi:hypothetical protein